MSDEPSDRELVEQARGGERAAFALLFERYSNQIFGLLVVISGDRDVAADLTQESFMLAHERLDQLNDPEQFRAWLYQIARNRWRDVLRGRQGMQRAVERLGGHPLAGDADWSRIDPLAELAERDLVARTLADLRRCDREVLALRHFWQLSGAEIAELLNITPAAAQRRVNRAEERFRERYRELAGEEPHIS